MISASILAARRRKLLEDGRTAHLPRLRNMVAYRRELIGRRLIVGGQETYLPRKEMEALEWAIELLEDEGITDSGQPKRKETP
jgi:hypothetical protein